jgi:8-oxo-dGTP pyrophosphatase MutT (NUDIX family)
MNLLATLTQKDIYPDVDPTPEEEYVAPRKAVRVVLLDNKGRVALGAVPLEDGSIRYSLIGGGIDEGESIEEALVREAKEEAGCNLRDIQELGIVEERGVGDEKRGWFIQTNYCFFAYVDGEKFEPHFTESDKKVGLTVVWLPLTEAIVSLEKQRSTFITKKGVLLLKEVQKRLVIKKK